VARSYLFAIAVEAGDRARANRLWDELGARDRDWNRAFYRPGDAERSRSADLFYRGELTEEYLAQAEKVAKGARNRAAIKALNLLRGEWYLVRNEPARAVESLAQAVCMSHEVGKEDIYAGALLVLAQLYSNESVDACGEAERLGLAGRGVAALAVAKLWRALNENDRAVEYAQRAHRWAISDGDPYLHRYYLDQIRELLVDLGAPLAEVPRYDTAKAVPYPWEKDVRAFVYDLWQSRRSRGEDETIGLEL
jgi:tetratricopeptide (TPR) repeat protein